jgi:hypothetical protein
MAKRPREIERRMAEGRPKFAEDVATDLNRLGGRSRSDLATDDRRGAASPLGMGSHSKKEKRR